MWFIIGTPPQILKKLRKKRLWKTYFRYKRDLQRRNDHIDREYENMMLRYYINFY